MRFDSRELHSLADAIKDPADKKRFLDELHSRQHSQNAAAAFASEAQAKYYRGMQNVFANHETEAVKPNDDERLQALEREYVNYCRLHPSKPIEWTVWHDAAQLGYAEGLKAGRSSIETNTGWPHEKKLHEELARVRAEAMKLVAAIEKAKFEGCMWMVTEALAEYHKGGDDATR